MKSVRIVWGAAALSAVVLLSSCGTKPQEATLDSSYMTSVDNRLNKAAEQAAKAQTDLARIQKARTNPSPLPLDEIGMNLPDELKRPATLEWSGPAHEAAKRIAALVGYQFSVVGNPPSIPPVIHVSLQEVPAAKALEQIGLQAFPFGEVAVDPNQKRVEFRYLQEQTQPVTPRGTSPSWGK
jgi:defect-in-organelle-trafficking protein DotD